MEKRDTNSSYYRVSIDGYNADSEMIFWVMHKLSINRADQTLRKVRTVRVL